MIPILRGREPDDLRQVRARELPVLRQQARSGTIGKIKGYNCVAMPLWTMQHHKCCYCELIIPLSYNDVEHYRPKAKADRSPGCTTDHGYWWLAFHWENLLISCAGCNRSAKKTRFPLDVGSVTLAAGRVPPGQESPLLLDPARDNGIEHIEFVPRRASPGARMERWVPIPRQGSRRGWFTIDVLRLDRQELLELYEKFVGREVQPVVQRLQNALRNGDPTRLWACYQEALDLLVPGRPLVGLAYDALRWLVADATLAPRLPPWPSPAEIGVQRPGRRRERTRPT